MEELLILVLQVVIQFLGELLGYTSWVLIWWYKDRWSRTHIGISMLIVGGLLGGVFNLIHPHLLLPTFGLRVGALFLGPFVAGGISWSLTRWRQKKRRSLIPMDHFIAAFCFVFAFDAVRLAFGTS